MKPTLLRRTLLQSLKIDPVRNLYCWARYFFLKGRMKVMPVMTDGVGQHTVEHNMSALHFRAAFGMGNRMALLLYPLAAALRNVPDAKVLIVGPRTEDDLYWARSLGVTNVRGLDLFSYSPWIDIGDIHHTSYEDREFDAVILGWVISYSEKPEVLVAECKRITKPGGYLGFGIESNSNQRSTGKYGPPRVNALNSGKDIADIVKESVVFIHDPEIDIPTDNAVLFQLAQPR
jgi:SAM-dependent methyltransferase